jgi:hypothetical protein
MKPTLLTINTTAPSPKLPTHHNPPPTIRTTTSRRSLLALLSLATLSTLTLLYISSPTTTHLTLPTFTTSTHKKAFTQNPAYNDLSPSADGNWSNLLPPNGGFFSSKVGDGYEMVGLTMFHQLHCLSMIRGALQQQGRGEIVAGTDRRRSESGEGEDLFGVRRKRSVESEKEDLFGVRRKRSVDSKEDLFGVRRKRGEGHERAPEEHYLHCFDYLVQVGLNSFVYGDESFANTAVDDTV